MPPAAAIWREGGPWRPGLIVGHNDAAPYNAAWANGRLVGFFDWDFAAAVTREWDLAFTAFAWVPLHARHVVAAEGFTHSGTGLDDYSCSWMLMAGSGQSSTLSRPFGSG